METICTHGTWSRAHWDGKSHSHWCQ